MQVFTYDNNVKSAISTIKKQQNNSKNSRQEPKKTEKSPRKRPSAKKNQNFFHLRTSELRKKAKKTKKKFCQFGKRLYFCNPKTRESDERGIGARSLKATETEGSVPARREPRDFCLGQASRKSR